MPTLKVINLEGKSVGKAEVSDEVFSTEVKEHLLWEVVRAQRAKARAGTAKTKERGEIRGTTAKVYRQKGTGRARHGNKKSNIFRGGGGVHGPRPRSYAIGVNRKVMKAALRSALSLRAKEGDLLVVRDLTMPEIKTKALAAALDKLEAPHVLLVDSGDNRWLRLSSRNLARASFLDERGLNVYDVLRFPKLVMSEAALKTVDARLGSGEKA